MAVNVWTFLFQLVNFVVLVYVLWRLLYRPLHEAIDRRKAANAKAQAEAERARADAASLQQHLNEELTNLDRQREALLQQARERAEAERKTMIAETEQAIARRREETEQQLERARTEALEALRTEIVGSAVALADRCLSEAANSTLDEQLAQRLVETLQAIPPEQRERLRADWEPADRAVVEASAHVNGAILQHVQSTLDALAGRPVEVTVEPSPALRAGLRVRLGGHVWDASLVGGLGEPAPAAPRSGAR